MPIRYFVDLNCTPRETLGSEELLTLVSRWERARGIRAQFHEKQGVRDESVMRYRERVVMLGHEAQSREVSVAEVRQDCQPLQDLAFHCMGCPAALNGQPYGCIQRIALPVSAAAEQWLVDQIAPSGTRAADIFLRACESQSTGRNSMLPNWRKAGFLASTAPAVAERNCQSFNSDCILTELLLVGDIMPMHALGVLIHLNVLTASDGRRGDDLLAMIETVDATASAEEAATIEFDLPNGDADDLSIRQFKQFLFAIYTAFSLQTPLAIRL